ncbi:hypothetical protein DL98DRAFT_536357 [Cadophora sp. DSE1049]|nr:hypothetical protein DL98DRAFT_536357 [Cadophora sp. DSE1049]
MWNKVASTLRTYNRETSQNHPLESSRQSTKISFLCILGLSSIFFVASFLSLARPEALDMQTILTQAAQLKIPPVQKTFLPDVLPKNIPISNANKDHWETIFPPLTASVQESLSAALTATAESTGEHQHGGDTLWHLSHCIQYLTQAVLCAGDMSLEEARVDNVNGTLNVGVDGWQTQHSSKLHFAVQKKSKLRYSNVARPCDSSGRTSKFQLVCCSADTQRAFLVIARRGQGNNDHRRFRDSTCRTNIARPYQGQTGPGPCVNFCDFQLYSASPPVKWQAYGVNYTLRPGRMKVVI